MQLLGFDQYGKQRIIIMNNLIYLRSLPTIVCKNMKLSKTVFIYVSLSLTALIHPSCQSNKSSSGTGFLSNYSGLQRSSKLNNKLTYTGDINKVRDFDNIYLEEVTVLKPLEMTKKKIAPEDLVRLQQKFKTALQSAVKKSHFNLVSSSGPRTLSVRMAIVDISPGDPLMFAASNAPYAGTATTVAGVVTGAKFGRGSAKVEAEIINSVTREQIYSVIDENVGSKLEIIQGMTRWGHVELAVKQWSKQFAEFLDDPSSVD